MIVATQLLSYSSLTLTLFFVLLTGIAFFTAKVLCPSKKTLFLASLGSTPPLLKPTQNHPTKPSSPGSPSKQVSFGGESIIPPPSYKAVGSPQIHPNMSPSILKPSAKKPKPSACQNNKRGVSPTFPSIPETTRFKKSGCLDDSAFSPPRRDSSAFSPPRRDYGAFSPPRGSSK